MWRCYNFIFCFQIQLEDGSPVVYQPFQNIQYQQSVSQHECSFQYFMFSYGYLSDKGCVNLTVTKLTSRNTVYPVVASSSICTLLMLTNLAHPDLVQINCSEKLLANILCIKEHESKFNALAYKNIKIKDKFCPFSSIAINSNCFLFLWHDENNTESLQQQCQEHHSTSFFVKQINFLHFSF